LLSLYRNGWKYKVCKVTTVEHNNRLDVASIMRCLRDFSNPSGNVFLCTQATGRDIEQIMAHLEELVDVDKLIEGWRYLKWRHPVPRTSFRWLDCLQPLQEVQRRVDLAIVRLDWSDLDRSELDISVFLSADRRPGFDLGHAARLAPSDGADVAGWSPGLG
jgi:hypothetical protein